MKKKKIKNDLKTNQKFSDTEFKTFAKQHLVLSKAKLIGVVACSVAVVGGAVGTAVYFATKNNGGGQVVESYKHIAVNTSNARTSFFIGEQLSETDIKSGLSVTLFNGTDKDSKILKEDEYDVNIIDTSSLGEKTVNVTYKNDKTAKSSYKVNVMASEEVTTSQWLNSFYRISNNKNVKSSISFYDAWYGTGDLTYLFECNAREDYSTTLTKLLNGNKSNLSCMFRKDKSTGKTIQLFNQHTDDGLFVSHEAEEATSSYLPSSISFDDLMNYTGLLQDVFKDEFELVQDANGAKYYKGKFIKYVDDGAMGKVKKIYELNLYFNKGELTKAMYYDIDSNTEDKTLYYSFTFKFCNSKEEVIPDSELPKKEEKDDMFPEEYEGDERQVSVKYNNLNKGYDVSDDGSGLKATPNGEKLYIDSTIEQDNLMPSEIVVNKPDGNSSKFKDNIYFWSSDENIIKVDSKTGELKINKIDDDYIGLVNIYYTVATYTGEISIPVIGDNYIKGDEGKIYRPAYMSGKDRTSTDYIYHVGDTYNFEDIYNTVSPKLNFAYQPDSGNAEIKSYDAKIDLFESSKVLTGSLTIVNDETDTSSSENITVNDGDTLEIPTGGYTFSQYKRYEPIKDYETYQSGCYLLNFNLRDLYFYSFSTSPFEGPSFSNLPGPLFDDDVTYNYSNVKVLNEIDARPVIMYRSLLSNRYVAADNDCVYLNKSTYSFEEPENYGHLSDIKVAGIHDESFDPRLLNCKLTIVDDGSAGCSHTYFLDDEQQEKKSISVIYDMNNDYMFEIRFKEAFCQNNESVKIKIEFDNSELTKYNFELTVKAKE